MYRGKEREQEYLFKELMPFGGQLEEGNRWLRIKAMIPWGELEGEYANYFSNRGRPGLDGRLVIGLFLLKHMTGLSDRELILQLQENVYWQAFCWQEGFSTSKKLNSSSMTRLRKRLGAKFTKELEKKTYEVLVRKKIIKRKGVMVDATVVPEKIKYPNDVGLLNDVREWLVKCLRHVSGKTGEKIRTYCRKAKKTYVNFSKRKKKTGKDINRARRQMLQYVRRNLKQLKERLKDLDGKLREEVEERLKIAEMIFEQQMHMHREKVRRVNGRIVNFWRPYVRPIKRGKSGKKDVEFGPKVSLSLMNGFVFVDEFRHENYSEADPDVVEKQLEKCHNLTGSYPPSLTGDQLYGSRANRKLLESKDVRGAFKKLGRPGKKNRRQEQYVKRKQRERNQIEGAIGDGKEHYKLDGIRYHGEEGSEMWVRLGFLAKNLKMAASRTA